MVGAAVPCEGAERRSGPCPLVWVLCAACAGVGLDRALDPGGGVWCVLVGLALGCWGVLDRIRLRFSAAAALLAGVAALAGLWHYDRWSLFAADELARFAADVPHPVCVQALVTDASRSSPGSAASAMSSMAREETTRLAVRLLSIRHGSRWRSCSGHATLLVQGRLTPLYRGDRVSAMAFLVRTRVPANPGEPDFAAMRRRERLLAELHCQHPACVSRMSAGSRWHPLRWIGQARHWCERALTRHVGPEYAPLAAALLLGTRERLDETTVRTFFVSGTIHLLAISGLHVGILASAFWLLLRLQWLPRRATLSLICIAAVAYALLTGARPPVVRATALILILCLARWNYRRTNAWNSLAAAALWTLAVSPDGMFDTGTQLSFLAVATLIGCHAVRPAEAEDPLDRLIASSRPWWVRQLRRVVRGVWEVTRLSTAIWLTGTPLVANRFHLVAPVGIVMNVLLWLPIMVALFSAVALLCTAWFPLLADLSGGICEAALAVADAVTGAGASLPGGHWWVSGPSLWWVVGFYALLALSRLPVCRVARWWQWALVAGWSLAGIADGSGARRTWQQFQERPLRITFVSVGHGTCVLTELPGGRTVLYDAGRMGHPQTAAMPICSLLWARRIEHLDAIVLSHADADHFNAVPALLDRFSVGTIYVSPFMFRKQTAAVAELRAAIEAAQVPVAWLCETDRLATGCGVTVSVLHPPASGCGSSDNACSIVLCIEYLGRRVLLPGDVEADGLDELLAEMPLPCDVLMAPHHGSAGSQPARMIAWAEPAWVVLCAGQGSRVDQAAFARLGPRLYSTHRDGAVQVEIDREGVRTSCWRERRR
ncbi:MAG: ComEC/Rec2 family competence protein [Planctomycetes bacterium]|nr:ComEC/Rec2 family competence protein [Planctomycetota bacterium]